MKQQNDLGYDMDYNGPAGENWVPAGFEEPQPAPRHHRWVPVILCAVLLVALLVECGVVALAVRAKRQANAIYVGQAETVEAAAGEPFAFGPLDRQVTVQSAEDMGWAEGLSQENKLVRVACRIDRQADYSSGWDAETYLECDGQFYAAAGPYLLEEQYPELAMRALEGYDFSDQSMNEGWVYFVVPKEAQQGTFWLHELHRNEDYETESVHAVGVAVEFAQGGGEDVR